MQDILELEGYVDSSFKNNRSYSVFKFVQLDKYFIAENTKVPSSSDAEFEGLLNVCSFVIKNYPNIKSLKIITDSQSAKNTFFRHEHESTGINKRIIDAQNIKEIFNNLKINLNIEFQFRNTCTELTNCDHIARMLIQGRKDVSFVDFENFTELKVETITDTIMI